MKEVIHTYSVLIMNQKTIDLYNQYQPLFFDAVNSNRIGVCKWVESATSIDTALPELADLTDDKVEWNAIIVRYIDEEGMAPCEMQPGNPYDFRVHRNDTDMLKESPVPLVRLTHMLGGIPPLEVKFEQEVIKEDRKAPRVIYKPSEIKEEVRLQHEALAKKYEFDGKQPKTITIVSLRHAEKENDQHYVNRAWAAHKERESSEFWKRNHYPSKCRFLVYDFINEGPVRREEDNFRFWLSVMLLAVNRIDAGIMQAYRLYTLNTVLDADKMQNSFQQLADRLRDARTSIQKSIKRDIAQSLLPNETLPQYHMEVAVPVRTPENKDVEAGKSMYGMLSDDTAADMFTWNMKKGKIEKQVADSFRLAERSLDQTADKLRDTLAYDEAEVQVLTKYQEEDLERESTEIYRHIVTLQGTLPGEEKQENEEVEAASRKVYEFLRDRILKVPAILTIVAAVVLFLLTMVPAVILYYRNEVGDLGTIGWSFVGITAAILAAAAIVVLINKYKLNKLIEAFNIKVKATFNRLVENTGDYSRYMSEIASHVRAASYRNISDRKKHSANTAHTSKYKHIQAINALLNKVTIWSKIFYLDVDTTSKRVGNRIDVDVTVLPAENRMYALESGKEHDIEVNNSGFMIRSPFAFVRKIEITREELYDDEI